MLKLALPSAAAAGPTTFAHTARQALTGTRSTRPPMPNSPLPQRIVIATRESPLALYQANHVAGLLRGLYPSLIVDLLGMTTRGDQILDRSLAAVGGKGLFIKELEQALEAKQADLAVHSLKDVPM